MPQRRGNDRGADADVALALKQGLQGLRELLERVEGASGGHAAVRGRPQGSQGGGRGQGRNPSSSAGAGRNAPRDAAANSDRKPQVGDWRCRGCGFQPNFARRHSCFECRRPRSPPTGRAGGRGGQTDARVGGPIGANGSRPLLGQRPAGSGTGRPANPAGPEREAPTYRVPGASVAARASAQSPPAKGPRTQEGEPARGLGAASATGPTGATSAAPSAAAEARTRATRAVTADGLDDIDDDGFRPVRGRGAWRRARGAAASANQGGAAEDVEGQDRSGDGDGARNNDGGGEEGGEPVLEEPATPNTLHKAWQGEVAVVRRLKQQGLAASHPAMRAACDARDSAEKAWRGAKDPAPAAVRLARAQAKFDRAIEIRDETLQVLADYEAAHKEKLSALHARLDEDRDRVSLRREQLEAVQEEVGAEGHGAQNRAAQDDAAKHVHAALCGTIAPTIASLVEQVDTASPAWTALNGLLATLANSKEVLEKAFTRPRAATQSFVIADDGAADDAVNDHESEGGTEWSESHELHGPAPAEGGARGAQATARPGGSAADDADQCMGTDNWWDSPSGGWNAGARWEERSHGKWARFSWADNWEEEHQAADSAPVRRRLEPRAAAAAALPPADAADETAAAEQRKRQHGERLQRIVLAAIDAGVQPISASGEELHLLDPHALDAWVAENLPGAVAA